LVKWRRYRYLLYTAVMAAIPATSAAQREPLEFVVGQGVAFDSNIFRLAEEVVPSPIATGVASPPRSETFLTTYAGANFDRFYSRQHLRTDFRLTRYSYRTYKRLDSNGISGTVAWDWEIGDGWKGVLNYERAQTPTSDATRTGFQTAYRLDQRYTATVDYSWRPAWMIGGGLVRNSNRYNNSLNPFADYDADVIDAHVKYSSRKGNQLRVLARNTHSRYSSQSVQAEVPGPAYLQMDYEVDTTWVVDPHRTVVGRIGYSRFDHEGLAPGLRSFDGPTGHLLYDWTLTDKTLVSVVLRRDITPEVLYYVNGVIDATSAASVAVSWSISPRISLRGVAELQRQLVSEVGTADSLLRNADSTQFAVTGNWKPERYLTFRVGFGHEARTADNLLLPRYVDNTLSANVEFMFH
jgi:hypothetical protein